MRDTKRRILPVCFFALIIVIFLALGYSFFPIWRGKGNNDAQAYAAFLSYVATATTVLVTLIYVYFTRESLLAAKSAVDLQREQWQRSTATEPRFWIEKKRIEGSFALGQTSTGALDEFRFEDFDCVIWNYSDKSILVSRINLTPTDGEDSRHIAVQQVVRPHTVERFRIGLDLLQLYVPDITSSSRGVLEAYIVLSAYASQLGQKNILLSLDYSDWMHRDTKSETLDFSIRKATQEESRHPAAFIILPAPRLENEANSI